MPWKVALVFAVLFRGLLFDGLVFVGGVGVPVPERSCSRTLSLTSENLSTKTASKMNFPTVAGLGFDKAAGSSIQSLFFPIFLPWKVALVFSSLGNAALSKMSGLFGWWGFLRFELLLRESSFAKVKKQRFQRNQI